MKKIIHKLKKNRLVSKIAALFTICMILVSLFTVSSFAADEEETTNSITDVWTSITGSIVSLFGSAQNVFITQSISGESSGSFVLPQRSSSLGDWAYLDIPFSDHSLIEVGSSFTFFYPSADVKLDFVFEEMEYGGVSYLDSVSQSGPYTYTLVIDKESNTLSLFTDLPADLSGGTIQYGVFEYESQLSFLGTLAVLGLALGIILLLVYVIVNFLRLRG